MADNLKKRGNSFYVRVGVNPKHWDVVGIVRSLKTTDRRVAERIKYKAIAEIKEQTDRAVESAGLPKTEPRWLLNIVWELRGEVAAGRMNTDDAGELMELMREEYYKSRGYTEELPRVHVTRGSSEGLPQERRGWTTDELKKLFAELPVAKRMVPLT